MQTRLVLATALALTLCACSGDGSSGAPVTPAPTAVSPIAGHWKGEVLLSSPVAPQRTATQYATLYADALGEFMLYITPIPPGPPAPVFAPNLPFLLHGEAGLESDVELSATAFEEAGAAGVPVQLTLNAASGQITGEFEFIGYQWTLELAPVQTNPPRLTMAELASVYSGRYGWYVTPAGWTLTIQSNGAVTGADDYGCVWTGSASIPNPDQNLFRFALEAAGCADVRFAPAPGAYEGFGMLVRERGDVQPYPGQDVIDFNLVGPIWLGDQTLAR